MSTDENTMSEENVISKDNAACAEAAEGLRFSVIVPVYNGEKYLRECIESILAETIEEDYEIILVDDGSTDSTPAICDSYRDKYPGIVRVIHKDNEGTLRARCDGFMAARGKYMVSADSDDLMSPELLKKVGEVIDRYGADLVMFESDRIKADGTKALINKPHTGEIRKIEKDEIYRYWRDYGKVMCCAMWGKVFLKELYNFDKFCSDKRWDITEEDVLQTVDIEANATNIYHIDEVLYHYRINPLSVMQTFFEKHLNNLRDAEPTAHLLERAAKEGIDIPGEVIALQYPGKAWASICALIKSGETKARKKEILDEIRSYESVKAVRKYVDSATNLRPHQRLGLKIFYSGHDDILILYESLIWRVKRIIG